jgi:hypothetical protein
MVGVGVRRCDVGSLVVVWVVEVGVELGRFGCGVDVECCRRMLKGEGRREERYCEGEGQFRCIAVQIMPQNRACERQNRQ